jgi:hypothetical protein
MSTLRVNGIVDGVGGNTATVNGKLPLGTSDLATQLEAQAGTDNTKVMTPLRAAQAIAALGGIAGVNTLNFSSSGTYTPTSGYRFALCILIGGGGGGGGSSSTAAGTIGGCGTTVIGVLNLSGLAAQTVTIGAGGAGGGTGLLAGTAGGTTSIGSLITAGGGPGGAFNSGAPNGSTGTGGVILTVPSVGGSTVPGEGASPFFMPSRSQFTSATSATTTQGRGGAAPSSGGSVGFVGSPGGNGYVIIVEFK